MPWPRIDFFGEARGKANFNCRCLELDFRAMTHDLGMEGAFTVKMVIYG